MAGVQRFTDLIAWQKARALNAEIYALTKHRQIQQDRAFISQIRRASVSVMSNIAEGFERNRLQEFHQFLSIAKASAAEVHSLLYVALDVGYCSSDEFDRLQHQVKEVGLVIGGLRASISRSKNATQ